MLINFRGIGKEGERDRNINWLALKCTLAGDHTHNLGMCPEQESNP